MVWNRFVIAGRDGMQDSVNKVGVEQSNSVTPESARNPRRM